MTQVGAVGIPTAEVADLTQAFALALGKARPDQDVVDGVLDAVLRCLEDRGVDPTAATAGRERWAANVGDWWPNFGQPVATALAETLPAEGDLADRLRHFADDDGEQTWWNEHAGPLVDRFENAWSA